MLRDPDKITFYLHEQFIVKFHADGNWYEFRMKPEAWLVFMAEMGRQIGSARVINFTVDLTEKMKKR